MKGYKDYEKIYLGSSDIAQLTVVGPRDCGGSLAESLDFGIDSNYWAYLVDDKAEIGEHYKLVLTCKGWMRIFDDEELTFRLRAGKINIYRAGDAGCIIQALAD